MISIWVCMNIPENSLDYYRMTNEKVLGSYDWGGKLDMLNIVVIGLAKEIPEHDEKYELHRLLSVLLSPEMEPMKKCEIIENEYRIQVEDEVREEMNIMCNLGEGLWEEAHAAGRKEGLATGRAEGYDVTMLDEVNGGNGYGIKPDKNPDFLINGRVFDCYSPQSSTKPDGVIDNIAKKTESRRIELSLIWRTIRQTVQRF